MPLWKLFLSLDYEQSGNLPTTLLQTYCSAQCPSVVGKLCHLLFHHRRFFLTVCMALLLTIFICKLKCSSYKQPFLSRLFSSLCELLCIHSLEHDELKPITVFITESFAVFYKNQHLDKLWNYVGKTS